MKNNNQKPGKVKQFFLKVKDYIKNTAWIQPLLIVIVIFVILFSLNPIVTGISSLWTKMTTVNHMDKITYAEYVEKVKNQGDSDDDDFVIVFTQSSCDVCPKFYKGMNTYLKESTHVTVYNVDLSVKSIKKKINGVKYQQYKDKTAGILALSTTSDQSVLSQDYVLQLDQRIEDFANSFGDTSYTDLTTVSGDNAYQYMSTPLVIWYHAGVETRVSNTFESSVSFSSTDSKTPTASSFRTFIEDKDGSDEEAKAYNWTESFDLTYGG